MCAYYEKKLTMGQQNIEKSWISLSPSRATGIPCNSWNPLTSGTISPTCNFTPWFNISMVDIYPSSYPSAHITHPIRFRQYMVHCILTARQLHTITFTQLSHCASYHNYHTIPVIITTVYYHR